jgi:hypothetical protein
MKLDRLTLRLCSSLLLSSLAVFSFSGCETTSAGSALGFKGARERTGLVWNTPLPEMEPPGPNRRTIYVQFRDASGTAMDLRKEVRGKIESMGYTLERDPDKADYRLQATLRFFGENPAADEGRNVAATLGGVAGFGTAAAVYSTGRALGAPSSGAMASAGLLGVMGGIAMSNATTAVEWNMIIDFAVAEKIAGGVRTQQRNSQEREQSSGFSSGTGGGAVSGNQVDRSMRDQETDELRRSHLIHGARVTAWASQWQMKKEKAQELLLPQLINAISNAVPPAD